MPIYEYECSQCRTRFEIKQGFFDAPFSSCPHCHGPAHRVFHPVGIVFKGSGFYSTDNRKSNGGASSSRESVGDASTGDAKVEKAEKVDKVEKPEAKAEASSK